MSADVSRRGFLKLAWGAAGAVALAEAGGVAYMFLSPRTVEGEFGGIFTAGAMAGTAKRCRALRAADQTAIRP